MATKKASKTTENKAVAADTDKGACEAAISKRTDSKPWQFKAGQSGNPSGRPKMPEELRQAFRAASVDACRVLCEIVNDPSAKDSDRIKAAEVIMDRGYGKPLQQVDVDAQSIPQVVFVGDVKP